MTGEVPKGKMTIGHNDEGYTVVYKPPVGLNRLLDVTVSGFVQNGPVIRAKEGGIRAVRYYSETVDLDSEGSSAALFLEKHQGVAREIDYILDPAEIVDLRVIAQARSRQQQSL